MTTRILSSIRKTNDLFDIIDSCKQYIAEMSHKIKEPIIQEVIIPIETVPPFKLKEITPVEEVSAEVKELFGNMARNAYIRMIKNEREQEVLAKANQYNIPYSKFNINWLQLITQVDSYEDLLSKADEYNIAWDISVYDPLGLKEEIEAYQHAAYKDKSNQYWDYHTSK